MSCTEIVDRVTAAVACWGVVRTLHYETSVVTEQARTPGEDTVVVVVTYELASRVRILGLFPRYPMNGSQACLGASAHLQGTVSFAT